MDILTQLFFYFEYIFWFLLVFTIIVFIHEFGHFYVARLNKVKVDKFSVGFGPAILKFKDSRKTIWQVCLIPLGGYVKFAGEMYPEKESNKDDENSRDLFMNKTSLQKASIVLAGPFANFILGIILFIIIFVAFGKNYTPPIIGNIESNSPSEIAGFLKNDKILEINKEKINSFEDIYNILDDNLYEQINFQIERNNKVYYLDVHPEIKTINTFIGSEREINYLGINPIFPPLIKKVLEDSPANKAGLKSKDKILEIDSVKVKDIEEVISIIEISANQNLNFLVIRDNKYLNINIIPENILTKDGKEKGRIGIIFSKERKKINFLQAIAASLNNFFTISYKTLIAFSEIIFGKRDHCEVGGPILIAKVSNDVASQDLISFMSLVALISINLGLINLFPLPLLDGGHFFTYMYEFINKKKVTKVFYKYFQTIGLFIIISLMFFSVFNDIYCRVLN